MSTAVSVVQEATAPLRVLHLGCGRKGRDVPLVPEPLIQVQTLDADPFLKPDFLCRLGTDRIPLPDDSIDVAVAHHVLEHIGKQGETGEWFFFFEDLYRVLVPGGELRFASPMYDGVWCWADPTHTRALSPQSFVFFAQDSYRIAGSAISPYRIRCDFVQHVPYSGIKDSNPEIAEQEWSRGIVGHFCGVLVARKPLTPWWEDHA